MRFLKENYLIWVIAVAIGILTIAPSFYFRYFDSAYRGFEFFASDAEPSYLAQIQEIYDGHWSLGNIYLADHKDDPYLQQPLSPMIVAFLGRIAGVSARDINLATKFFLPALLTVLLYVFFASVFGRKDIAIAMALFIMLTQATWTFLNPRAWPEIFLNGKFPGTDSNLLSYSRPINPQVSSFFFFGYLLAIWKFLFGSQNLKSERRWGIASAVILGLSVYTYFFAVSFLWIFNLVLASWFLYSKNWDRLKKFIYVLLGAVIIGIPYLLNSIQILQSPFYLRVARIQGVLDSHKFIFSRVWWGVTALFLLLYRGSRDVKVFILAFLAAAFLVTNQQLITGKTVPVPAHYHWYYIAPVAGALLIYLFFYYFEKLVTFISSKWLIGIVIALFFYAGFLFQKNSYFNNYSYFVEVQRYAPILFWLDKNIEKEASIFTNDDLGSYIPAYTKHNIYSGGNVPSSLISEEQVRHVYFFALFLNGVNEEDVRDFFYENRGMFGNWFFGQYYRQKNGCYGCFPDSVLDSLIQDYRNFLDRANKNFLSELKKYPVDYVIWDTRNDSSWKLNRFFNEKIYEDNGLVVYKVK